MKLWQDTQKTIPALKESDPVAVIETSDGEDLTIVRADTATCYAAPRPLSCESRREVGEYLAHKFKIRLTQ